MKYSVLRLTNRISLLAQHNRSRVVDADFFTSLQPDKFISRSSIGIMFKVKDHDDLMMHVVDNEQHAQYWDYKGFSALDDIDDIRNGCCVFCSGIVLNFQHEDCRINNATVEIMPYMPFDLERMFLTPETRLLQREIIEHSGYKLPNQVVGRQEITTVPIGEAIIPLHMITDMCAFLQSLRRNKFAYVSLKPGNILLDSDGKIAVPDFSELTTENPHESLIAFAITIASIELTCPNLNLEILKHIQHHEDEQRFGAIIGEICHHLEIVQSPYTGVIHSLLESESRDFDQQLAGMIQKLNDYDERPNQFTIKGVNERFKQCLLLAKSKLGIECAQDIMVLDRNKGDAEFFKSLRAGQRIGEGGEAKVYRVIGHDDLAMRIEACTNEDAWKERWNSVTQIIIPSLRRSMNHCYVFCAYAVEKFKQGSKTTRDRISIEYAIVQIMQYVPHDLYKLYCDEDTRVLQRAIVDGSILPVKKTLGAELVGIGMPVIPIEILMSICVALRSFAGSGLCHRDIKAENIFVNEFGIILLGDFGMSSKIGGTQTNSGSPSSRSPEAFGGLTVTATQDYWAMGMLIAILELGVKYPNVDMCAIHMGKEHIGVEFDYYPYMAIPENYNKVMDGIYQQMRIVGSPYADIFRGLVQLDTGERRRFSRGLLSKLQDLRSLYPDMFDEARIRFAKAIGTANSRIGINCDVPLPDVVQHPYSQPRVVVLPPPSTPPPHREQEQPRVDAPPPPTLDSQPPERTNPSVPPEPVVVVSPPPSTPPPHREQEQPRVDIPPPPTLDSQPPERTNPSVSPEPVVVASPSPPTLNPQLDEQIDLENPTGVAAPPTSPSLSPTREQEQLAAVAPTPIFDQEDEQRKKIRAELEQNRCVLCVLFFTSATYQRIAFSVELVGVLACGTFATLLKLGLLSGNWSVPLGIGIVMAVFLLSRICLCRTNIFGCSRNSNAPNRQIYRELTPDRNEPQTNLGLGIENK